MSKFLGFLLGVVVALAGPAVFGVLAAPGGIELNTKEMALAFGIGALIFWTVVSYFSGAAALGAFAAFATLLYCWLWIPNRTTNFLNDIPGVTTGMIEGSRQYTLNGVVPILAVISLVYGIQLIVQSVQRRRRERADAERVRREQEAAQAQQEAEAAALYPVAGGTYPAEDGGYGDSYANISTYDDLFDEEPVQPRSQADEQTSQFPVSAPEQTAQFPDADAPDNDAQGNDPGDDTVLVPTDRDETTQVPVENDRTVRAEAAPPQQVADEQASAAPDEPTVTAPTAADEPKPEQPTEPQAQPEQPVAKADQPPAVPPVAAGEQPTTAAPAAPDEPKPEQPTAVAPVAAEAPKAEAPKAATPQPQEQPAADAQEPTVTPGEDQTVVAPVEKESVDGGQQAAVVAPGSAGKQQMGQQYRERMDDPEDTGELFISAFENPTQMSIRPAGA